MGSPKLKETNAEQIVKNLLFLVLRVFETPELQISTRYKPKNEEKKGKEKEEEGEEEEEEEEEKGEREVLHWVFRRLSYLARPRNVGTSLCEPLRVCVFYVIYFVCLSFTYESQFQCT